MSNQMKSILIQSLQDCDHSNSRISCNFREELNQMLFEAVHHNSKIKTLNQYINALKKGQGLSKDYSFTIQHSRYQFCKLKSIAIRKRRNSGSGQQLSYLAPSEIFAIISPQFLNGLGVYLQSSSSFYPAWRDYISNIQQYSNEEQLFQINQYTQQLQQFLAFYLQSHRNQQGPRELLSSLLMFNYFSIIDIATDYALRAQFQNLKQYSNLYQLYLRSSDVIQEKIISKILGNQSYWGRYTQLYQSHIPPLVYCIKNDEIFVATLFLYRLQRDNLLDKIKSKDVITFFAQKGCLEVLYVSTIYVLPKYNRKGHGKNILNVLKKANLPIVLCSSAHKQTSGLRSQNTNGQFYLKAGFQEFYSVEVQATDPSDKGCLSPNDQKHNQCSAQNCCYPPQSYKDESYYVYCP